MTLTDFCETTRNWFDVSRHIGEFTITDGTLVTSGSQFSPYTDYIRIVGSHKNDGVVAVNDILQNEEFNGAIWELAIPKAVLELVDKINGWEQKNQSVIDSPYQSESFGEYSYSKSSGTDGALSWKSQFKNELLRWKKI